MKNSQSTICTQTQSMDAPVQVSHSIIYQVPTFLPLKELCLNNEVVEFDLFFKELLSVMGEAPTPSRRSHRRPKVQIFIQTAWPKCHLTCCQFQNIYFANLRT